MANSHTIKLNKVSSSMRDISMAFNGIFRNRLIGGHLPDIFGLCKDPEMTIEYKAVTTTWVHLST